LIGLLVVFQLKRCPSNRLMLIRNRLSRLLGGESDVKAYHGGICFIWPLLQEYRFLDLSPMKISVNLSEITGENLREPSTYYFKACLDVDSKEEMHHAGTSFWDLDHDQIRRELQRCIEAVVEGQASSNRSDLNEERNQFLVELEQVLERELSDHGFRLLTISHKS
jgi:flotillin